MRWSLALMAVCMASAALAVARLKPAPAAEAPPRFGGLGSHSRQVATAKPEAQVYFDQGLNFLYAFNHDEAIRAFSHAAKLDPGCAMAHWGIALANGPHINNPTLPPDRARAAWEALTTARKKAFAAPAVERALIDALAKRYADPSPEDRKPLDQAYADAMRALWKQLPKDGDVGALFAESLMDLRPWDLWTNEGKAQPETSEVVATLEAVLAFAPQHPLALHLYIHAIEASPNPEKADVAADRLRFAHPGLGHLTHMPSHVDVRRGRWQQAVEANQRAVLADREYHRQVPRQGFYRLYMAHNQHMLGFAAMMQGESRRALDAMRTIVAEMPREWLDQPENAAIADGYQAAPIEVLLRFGAWEEILKESEPDVRFPVARTLRHAIRGVALAALKKPAEARKEQVAFRAGRDKTPKEAFFSNNSAADLYAVAEALLEGEILFREGTTQEALTQLRAAVAKEGLLRYDEPPGWIHPVRHALGATLLQGGEALEAERVYREDLLRWPENGWSLFGLAQSLEAQGKSVEAMEVRKRFAMAWKRADVHLRASCFCQAGLEQK